MVVFGWIKPEIDPLLPVSLPTTEYIGLQDVWLVGPVPQELKVYLIVLGVLRRELRTKTSHNCQRIKA